MQQLQAYTFDKVSQRRVTASFAGYRLVVQSAHRNIAIIDWESSVNTQPKSQPALVRIMPCSPWDLRHSIVMMQSPCLS